ncbi:superoxide dismutase family protein [Streptomyces sp. 3N207]|uniref:superoxide dismutase family protein n=1 Tax=Streptomyces sp. 3N207 TaxID=3457417 RepID=UPI003FD0B255
MRARMRMVGAGGAAVVTLVTALLAGSGSSTASDVPGDDAERAAHAGHLALQRLTDVLENLGHDADDSAEAADGDIDRLAALKDLRDLPESLRDGELGSVRVKVGSGEVEIVGSPVVNRLFRLGRGTADSSDPVIRHTADADAADAAKVTSAEAAGPGDQRTSILVRYDRFAPANAFIRPDAVTYDRSKVPAGAGIMVARKATEHRTTVRLQVRGLLPNRTYGAHVHTKPCGARPDDSGPHYQHRKDPVQPSTDPRYANPRYEVWLDFTTDHKGRGEAVSRHNWTFREGKARSVVLHEMRTSTKPGHAGQAGARLACFSVPLSDT